MRPPNFVVDRLGGANGPGWYVREVAEPYGRYTEERATEIAREQNEIALSGAEDGFRMAVERLRYHRRRVRNGVRVDRLGAT